MKFLLPLRVAWRNLFSSPLNLAVGLALLVATAFFVVASSVLKSLDNSASRSITEIGVGQIQLYSSKSREELQTFSPVIADLAVIPDFSRVKEGLGGVPNVKSLVPEAFGYAAISSGNSIDVLLERLRRAEGRPGSPENRGEIETLKSRMRAMLEVLQASEEQDRATSIEPADLAGREDMQKALSPRFWQDFDRDPLGQLEFLENKIAPRLPSPDPFSFYSVGTDLDAFSSAFPRLRIVDGKPVPTGHRGLLLGKFFYESRFKLGNARQLDVIREALHDDKKTISGSPDVAQLVKQNRRQLREIEFQLVSTAGKEATARLQKFLGVPESSLHLLLSSLFDLSDANFEIRYRFFYDQLAPLLDLYSIHPGDVLTLEASGARESRSINVTFYGTSQFKGLEKANLAGVFGLMDLMSFRDLYGQMTPERVLELERLKKIAGGETIPRDQAEAALFGHAARSEDQPAQKIDDAKVFGKHVSREKTEDLMARTYSQQELDQGMVLNVAVVLDGPSLIPDTLRNLRAASDRGGLELKVVPWQQTTGELVQFIFLAEAVLYFGASLVFLVALVVINGIVMVVAMQRVREIGTLRAIGAQRGFVLMMVLVETLILGLIFGPIGAALGAFTVKDLGHVGLRAFSDQLYFFFSGPRLFPSLRFATLFEAIGTVLAVAVVSALLPAFAAAKISPLRAMQAED